MTLIVVSQYENESDEYKVVGNAQPLGTLVKKEIVNHYGEQENETILTIKVPGHSYWLGRHLSRGYAPAEYQVYRVLWERTAPSNKIEMKCKQLTSFPVRTPSGRQATNDTANSVV